MKVYIILKCEECGDSHYPDYEKPWELCDKKSLAAPGLQAPLRVKAPFFESYEKAEEWIMSLPSDFLRDVQDLEIIEFTDDPKDFLNMIASNKSFMENK